MTQKFTVVFDLDGTLVDTAPDLMLAHNHVMKKFGYPSKSLDQSFEILQSKTKAQLLILTLGEEGSIGKTSNFEVKISSKKISDLRDTVGAGDTYMASILNWFVDHKIYNINLVKNLKKPDLSSMMDKASIAAALNCKKIGCNPPSREDIEIFINKENFENNA